MKTLIESIRYHDGKLPRNELQQMIDRREEAIPYLLEIMNELKQDYESFYYNRFDHMYAIFLLAQFRVKELYPLLIDILSLTGDEADDIFGDTITEDLGRILASVYDGDPEPLMRLIENPDVNEYVRGQGLVAVVSLVLNKQITREFAMDSMKQLLNGKLSDKNDYLNTEIVCCCDDLYPEEVYEDIKQLFERRELEPSIIGLATINSTLKKTKEAVLQESQQMGRYDYIHDTIAELQGWASFNQQQNQSWPETKLAAKPDPVKVEKIGRNDPCPCGSGKKYKKCCGK